MGFSKRHTLKRSGHVSKQGLDSPRNTVGRLFGFPLNQGKKRYPQKTHASSKFTREIHLFLPFFGLCLLGLRWVVGSQLWTLDHSAKDSYWPGHDRTRQAGLGFGWPRTKENTLPALNRSSLTLLPSRRRFHPNNAILVALRWQKALSKRGGLEQTPVSHLAAFCADCVYMCPVCLYSCSSQRTPPKTTGVI